MTPVLVGRSEEIGVLGACLHSALAGSSQCVLVQGSRGSGKSSLVSGFLANAAQLHVVRVTADEAETSLPYAVLDELSGLLVGARVDNRSIAPAARDALAEGAALLNRIDSAQADGGLVLVVDDVDLADRASLTALTFALRRLHFDQVLAILVCSDQRVGELPSGLLRLVAERGTTIQVGGLAPEDVVGLAARSGWGPLSLKAARRLTEHTGGNALHLVSVMEQTTPGEVEAVEAPLPVPRDLEMLVGGKLRALPDDARRVASALAILGPRTAVGDIAAIAAVPEPLVALELVQHSGLVELSRDPDGVRADFTHPLFRSVVLDTTGVATASALHVRAAALRDGAEQLGHLVAAATESDAGLVAALQAQAESRAADGRWRQAADDLLSAVRLSDPGPARDGMLIDAVELLLIDGDLVAAGRYADQLALLPPSPHRMQVEARIASLSGRHEDATALAGAAWSMAGDLRPRTRDDVAAMLAHMCVLQGDAVGAARWASEALASGLLPQDAAADTRVAGAIGLALTGQMEAGLAMLPDGDLDASSVAAGRHPELRARGMLRMWSDDLAGARADLRASAPSPGTVHGLEPYRLLALVFLGETEYRRGDWDAAAVVADHAVELVVDTGQAWLAGLAHAKAVFVAAARGHWQAADEHLQAARHVVADLGDQVTHAYVDDAAVHLAHCRGDSRAVVEAAQWLVAGGRAGGHEPGFLSWSVHHAEALLVVGRPHDALEALDRLQDVAQRRGRRSRLGAVARVRGQVHAAAREHGPARAAFEEALSVGDGAVDALESATVRAAYGRFLRRRGERRAAVALLTDARDRWVQLGAAPFVDRCDQELAACGHTTATGEPPTGHQRLTPQELAVARLVAAGRTNREVASEMFLSAKTVGYHLGNVYSKLDITSRTQLAVRLPRADVRGSGDGT